MQNMQMLNGNYWFQADASPVYRYLGSFDDSGVPVRITQHFFRNLLERFLNITAVCWDPSGMVHMQEGLTMAGLPLSDTTAVCWEPCQKGPVMD